MIPLLVSLAGGIGAGSRFVLDAVVTARARRTAPVGTFVVNVLGSFLLGMVVGWAAGGGGRGDLRAILGTGFLGGFTTFSTASVELVRLARAGRVRAAVGVAAGMLVAGLAAGAAGLSLTTL